MPTPRYETYARIEPIRPPEYLEQGFRVEAHDPAWFLACQWLMGEHAGEDASSPTEVTFRSSEVALKPYDGNAALDPAVMPPEAIIENEPGDWWTPGRRVRLGLEGGPSLSAADAADPALKFAAGELPPPYHVFNERGHDGRRLFEQRTQLGLAASLFAEVPSPDPPDLWDSAELVYSAEFETDGTPSRKLTAPRHSGGHVDWYTVDADGALPTPSPLPAAVRVFPDHVRYPGAPLPRWWQIEDAEVDVGGFPPDRSHFATMLLIDLVVSHSDDWFAFPIGTQAGNVVTLHEVVVTDSFGDTWQVQAPAGWTLFKLAGLATTSLVVWPTVATPLTGAMEEEVLIGMDEDANLLWAVERRLAGRDVPTPAEPVAVPGDPTDQIEVPTRPAYAYRPSVGSRPNWHPYTIDEVAGRRRFVQGRLADLGEDPPVLMPEPKARILVDPNAPATGPAHQIEPATVPTQGMRIERRWVLGRRTDGEPMLWLQRRRSPLAAPPASGLRFDVLEDLLPVRA